MSKKWIGILIAAAVLLVAAGVALYLVFGNGGPYVGTVTNAENGTPMANVSVSDGRNVVKTDENGAFSLKGYRKTRFITVTAPAGYTTEQYYIRTDKKVESYDFSLSESSIPAGAAHSFLQISDTEIGEKGTGEWLNAVKAIADEQKPAFLIHTGDICYEAGLKAHYPDMNTDTMGLPVRYIIGNHDYVDGKYGEELFESIYGPTWYSFEVGNVHYVVTPFGRGSDKKSGYNLNDRWRWLENDLKNTDPDMKVIMFNHTLCPSENYVLSFDRKELDLKQHNLIAWVFGHYHYSYIEENNGVLNISTARPDCGGIDSSPSGTRMISVAEDGSITTKLFYYDFSEPTAPEHTRFVTQLSGNILFCDTVLDDNRIYTATVDDDYPHNCGVYCLNAADGAVVWTFKTKNSVKNNVLISEDKLIAQDCAGNVYCLSKTDGAVIWQTSVSLGNALSTSTAPCISDGVVFAGGAAGVTALDLQTGKVIWENIRNHGEGSAAEFVVMGNKLLVSSHWDALVALDKSTGKQLWENKDGDIRFRSSTPKPVDENTILVADSDAIMLVDANTGEITHKSDLEKYNFSSSAQPVVDGTVAYIPTANHGIVAFDLNTKEILWECAVGKALVYTAPYTNGDAQTVEATPVDCGDSLLFGASDGRLYRISKADGSVLGSASVGAPIFGKAAVTDTAYYTTDFAGRVSCVEVF